MLKLLEPAFETFPSISNYERDQISCLNPSSAHGLRDINPKTTTNGSSLAEAANSSRRIVAGTSTTATKAPTVFRMPSRRQKPTTKREPSHFSLNQNFLGRPETILDQQYYLPKPESDISDRRLSIDIAIKQWPVEYSTAPHWLWEDLPGVNCREEISISSQRPPVRDPIDPLLTSKLGFLDSLSSSTTPRSSTCSETSSYASTLPFYADVPSRRHSVAFSIPPESYSRQRHFCGSGEIRGKDAPPPYTPQILSASNISTQASGTAIKRSQSPYLTSYYTYSYPPRRPSLISHHSYSSQDKSPTSDEAQKGTCPNPDCGRIFKDLKAHMLTHQNERPEKCPILTCEYHVKGFARKYDKNRHTLTHYKGVITCPFCPGTGSFAEKSFNRADVLKRHLTSVHGVEQTPPNSRRKTFGDIHGYKKPIDHRFDTVGNCSICSAKFETAQEFYEHLDECVLRIIQQEKLHVKMIKDESRLNGRTNDAQPVRFYKPAPLLCSFTSCEKGIPDNGFPGRWNLIEHMERVHEQSSSLPLHCIKRQVTQMPTAEIPALPIKQKDKTPVSSFSDPQLPSTPDSDPVIYTPNSGMASSEEFSDTESISDTSTVWAEEVTIKPYLSIDGIISNPCKNEEENQKSLRPILSPFKQALVDKIMTEFWTIVNQEWAANLTRCAGDTPASSASHGNMNTSSATSSPQIAHKKRQRDDEGDPPPEDNNGRTPKRPHSHNDRTKSTRNIVKFACPYRKHAPHTYDIYNYRSCALSHWETVARIKEHLYRRHRAPIQCKRCWLPFKTQAALDAHLTVVDICALRTGHPSEGLTSDLEKKLKSRKKASPDQTEEQRWREIYGLLFPNEVVPNPYFEPVQENIVQSPDSRALADYEEYSRQELPRVFRSYLEDAVNNETQHLQEHIRSHLVSIVQDCQDRMFAAWRSKCSRRMSQAMTNRATEDAITTPNSSQEAPEEKKNLDTSQGKSMLDYIFQPPTPQSTLEYLPDLQGSETSQPSSSNPIVSFSDSGYATTTDAGVCPLERTPSLNPASPTPRSSNVELQQYAAGESIQARDLFPDLSFDDNFKNFAISLDSGDAFDGYRWQWVNPDL